MWCSTFSNSDLFKMITYCWHLGEALKFIWSLYFGFIIHLKGGILKRVFFLKSKLFRITIFLHFKNWNHLTTFLYIKRVHSFYKKLASVIVTQTQSRGTLMRFNYTIFEIALWEHCWTQQVWPKVEAKSLLFIHVTGDSLWLLGVYKNINEWNS